MEIVAVENDRQPKQVRSLFDRYWASFGFAPFLQNFGEEIAGSPVSTYRRPAGWHWR
jgi:hypothetical protein